MLGLPESAGTTMSRGWPITPATTSSLPRVHLAARLSPGFLLLVPGALDWPTGLHGKLRGRREERRGDGTVEEPLVKLEVVRVASGWHAIVVHITP